MRILKIVPGASKGFRYANWLRDQSLVAELRWAGYDVTLVPIHHPLAGAPSEGADAVPLFYGWARIMAERRFPLIRRAPAKLRRWLDGGWPSRRVAGLTVSPSQPGFAELMLSTLRGEHGGQAGELEAFCDWLRQQPRPDVIHLSDALMMGLARRIGKVVQAPVVCSLQDEDIWIDAMPVPVANRVWAELRARAQDVSCFISSSHYFAAKMSRRASLSAKSVLTVHPGLDAGAYTWRAPPARPVWGVALQQGDIDGYTRVLSAFVELANLRAGPNLCLRVAGGQPSHADQERGYAALMSQLKARNLTGEVELLPPLEDQASPDAFFEGLTIFTVLHDSDPAFDLAPLKAMATGAVVVLPRRGSNPEILDMAEGGALYDETRSQALVEVLSDLLSDAGRLRKISKLGRYGVEHGFSTRRMARATIDAYEFAISESAPFEGEKRRMKRESDE